MEIEGAFWKNTTFLPNGDTTKAEELLRLVHKKREVEFFAFALKLNSSAPAICRESGFLKSFESVRNSDPHERERLLQDPHYLSWFRQTVRANEDDSLRTNLEKFERIREITAAGAGVKPTVEIDGHLVTLERFGLDPIISELAFPEYQLPDTKRREAFEREVEYPESYFKSSIEIALLRIKRAWPEAYFYFPRFVRIIVDMIDGEYTSYSSADHTGAIFVSTDNSPLVALEEFLIHEYGHQILYHLMELDAIVLDENESKYVLPWSGNERDIYGYFHAFYIYVFMGMYLEKVKGRSGREQRRIGNRRKHVVTGLEKSIPTFEETGRFTAVGRELFKSLIQEIEKLKNNLAQAD